MPDNVIEIGARVDAGPVQAGMQQISEAVSGARQRIVGDFQMIDQRNVALAEAFVTSTSESKQLAEAFVNLGASARGAAPAVDQVAAGMQHVQSASHGAVTEVQATSGAIRLLEGNGGIRAVERFVATTLGLGGAFQALFPLIGAAGLAGLVVKFGEELYEAFDGGGKRAQKTAEEIRDVNTEIERSTTSLDVQIDKLQQEQAKLEKKPFNGTKLALDEAAEAADHLAERLDQVIKKETEAISGMSASIPQRIFTGGSQTGEEQTMLREHSKWLGQATSEQGQLNESTSYGVALQTRLAELKQKQAAADALSMSTAASGGSLFVSNYNEEIKAVQQMISWQQKEHENIQKTIDLSKQEATTQGARDKAGADRLSGEASRKATEAENKAREAKLRAAEAYLAEWKQLTDVSAVAQYEYWSQQAARFAEGSQQYDQIQSKMAELAVEGARRAHEMIQKYKSEQQRSDREEQAEHLKLMQEQQEAPEKAAAAWAPYNKAVTESAEIQAKSNEEMEEAQLRAAEAEGGISKLSVAHAEARIHAEALRAELAELNAELERQQAKAPTDFAGNVTDPKAAAEIQRLKNQIAQLQGKGNAQAVTDTAAQNQAAAAPYMQATQQISSGLSGALASWERGQQSFVQAWGRSLGSMVTQLQGHLLQMGAMWVAHYIQQRLQHTLTNQANVASDASAAAQSKSIGLTTALAQANQAAMKAATNTYASTSAIPIIGPVLAPIAAAGAYTAVLGLTSLASAQGGWERVPADNTLANLHKDEMVMPANLSDRIRNMTGGSGTQITNNFGGNTFHGGGDDFPSMLDKHEGALASKIQGLHRDGHI